MPLHASVSILANPTAAKLYLLAFENCRISTNNKTGYQRAAFLPAVAGYNFSKVTTLDIQHADQFKCHPRDM